MEFFFILVIVKMGRVITYFNILSFADVVNFCIS